MARKPNYRFERLERERAKAAKKAAKKAARLEAKADGEVSPEATAEIDGDAPVPADD